MACEPAISSEELALHRADSRMALLGLIGATIALAIPVLATGAVAVLDWFDHENMTQLHNLMRDPVRP